MKSFFKKLLLILSLISSLFLFGCDKKPSYEDAFNYSEGLAAVKLNGAYGFIDETGKVIIEPTYEEATFFFNEKTVVKKYGSYGVINKKNETIIPFNYDELEYIDGNLLSAKKNGKYGIIDEENNIILDFISTSIIYTQNFKNTHKVAIITKGAKQGFIDLTTGFKIEAEFNNVFGNYEGNYMSFDDGMGKFYRVDLDTEEIKEIMLSENNHYNPYLNTIYPVLINGKYGFGNQQGETVIEPIYEEASSFENGLAAVRKDKKFGCINEKGEVVLDFIYDTMPMFSCPLTVVSLDGKQIVINTKGEIIDLPPLEYIFQGYPTYIENDSTPHFDVLIGSCIPLDESPKNIVMNSKGEILFYSNYENINGPDNNCYIVGNSNKFGCVNERGIEIIPVKYEEIMMQGENFFGVTLKGKRGIIDKNNKEIIPIIYDNIMTYDNKIIQVSSKEKSGIYNLEADTFSGLIYDEIKLPWDNTSLAAVKQKNKWTYIKP